ncbi:MAG: ABC transporter permease subunit [Gemmataceae bacterium]|nr:ABC transporter permease subunit [Gemmataceae bacterium]
MSFVQSSVTWLRRTFSFSNSRQAWEERIGLLIVLCAVIVGWSFGPRLTALQNVVLWTFLGVLAAVFLRRGWLKLFGPVLFYDIVRAGRRGRYFLLRCLYAGLLLFILFIVWLNTSHTRGANHQSAAQFAETYFETFMLVQLIAVCLLTPAYVAGAVSEEKDRKTLEFLLATDLLNREIVLSKLFSRLANLTLFVATGLPILGLLQFLGGVDPNLVLAGFAVTGLTMLGLGGVSILQSVIFKRPRDSIAITYLLLIAYLALGTTGFGLQAAGGMQYINFNLWFGANPPTFSDLVSVLNSGNVLVFIVKIGQAGQTGTLASEIPVLLRDYGLFHGILAALCVGWATLRLRHIALRQAYGRVLRAGARHKARPLVGELPMLWKEVSVEGGLRVNWVASILLAVLMLLTLAPGLIMTAVYVFDYIVTGGRWNHSFPREMNIYVRIVGAAVACLLILGVSVRASTCIGTERDKQTFDSLLTSPLSSGAMLWAKFLGSLFSLRLAWLWLLMIWGMGVLTGGMHIFALPLVLLSWFVFASFFTMLGLWFSMTAKSTMRATVYTVLGTVVISVGHWLLSLFCFTLIMVAGPGQHRAMEYIAKFQAGITPPAVIGILSFSGHEFGHDMGSREMNEMIGFCILGLFIWIVACMVFWSALLAPRFRQLTGRDEYRYPDMDYDPHEGEPRERRTTPPPVPEWD